MSHAVRIDYEGISMRCQSICEIANNELCKLNHMLDKLESEAKKLLNVQTDLLKKQILMERDALQNKIQAVINQAKTNARMGKVVVDSDYMGIHTNAEHVIAEAEELEKMTSRVSAEKIFEFESLLNQMLENHLEEHNQKLKDLANGKVYKNLDVQQKIDSMSNGIIKQYVYLAWIDHPNETFERLLAIAKKNKEKAEEKEYENTEKVKIEEIKTQLRTEKIDEETIKKITTTSGTSSKERIRKIYEEANREIIDEKVRKETVKSIVKALKNRGFIIENKSIKIDREKNEVVIIGMKPSGAKAQCKVYINGKFEYRFDGYYGQACQKDIGPFMQDLEDIYGIKVIKQTELWGGNPDKDSTMKYQTLNHNTNRR